jgi:hypothetical protein
MIECICVICGTVYDIKDGHGVDGQSHGYCKTHGEELLAGLQLEDAHERA